MASLFPQAIDSFANPVYTKIDGEDVVKAAHVNDIQDSLRATQEVIAGAGITINYASNRFIADNSSIKVVCETLDSEVGALSDDLVNHSGFVLPTDPAQHHSNVIEVTPAGNLSADRAQAAFLELQSDIDSIMSGGSVNSVTLDDRYVMKSGSQLMNGPLSITSDLTVSGNTIIGSSSSDTATVNAILSVTETLEVDEDITANSNILMQAGQKVAEEGATDSSYLMFESDKVEIYSHKDFAIRLDADDAVDGQADDAKFSIYNGLNNEVFSVDENGNLILSGVLDAGTMTATTSSSIGTLDIFADSAEFGSDTYHIQLDKDDNSTAGRFVITMDGDTANDLASQDLLLNLDESATLVTGIHTLKEGVQETGYFGMQVYSNNAGGVFYGMGVNFKHVMANTPASITLNVTENVNAQNISITDINQYGFFFTFDSVAVGAVSVKGTYTTVGN